MRTEDDEYEIRTIFLKTPFLGQYHALVGSYRPEHNNSALPMHYTWPENECAESELAIANHNGRLFIELSPAIPCALTDGNLVPVPGLGFSQLLLASDDIQAMGEPTHELKARLEQFENSIKAARELGQ